MKAIHIGIDQSLTSTGLVVLDRQGQVIDFRAISSLLPKDFITDRITDIRSQVLDAISPHKKHLVSITMEGLSYGSISSSTRTLAMLYGVLLVSIKEEFGLEPDIVPPTTLKKFATSSGKADKKEMFSSLPAETQQLFESKYKKTTGLYDVTDAYWLARHGLDTKGDIK